MTLEEFVKGLKAQQAVNEVLDVVATTGGKATVATRKDSMDKIRLKGGPKQYKTGKPGQAGQARLQQRVNRLMLDAQRLARKQGSTNEGRWAEALVETLRLFNAQVFAHSEAFDVATLINKERV